MANAKQYLINYIAHNTITTIIQQWCTYNIIIIVTVAKEHTMSCSILIL